MDKQDFSRADRHRIVDHVCNEIVAKKRSAFKVLAEDKDMCSYSLFKKWQRENEDIRDQVARAREDALEALIEEMIDISKNEKLDHNSRRVQLLAIEKAATMLAPRRFATQRMDVTTDGKPLALPSSSAERIDALIALAVQRRQLRLEDQTIDGECITLDDVMS